MYEILVTIFIASRILTFSFPEPYKYLEECETKAQMLSKHFNKKKKHMSASISCEYRDWIPA